MSRIPSFRSINLDLSGPLAQRAEASRVGGQLLSAKTPQEAQAFLGGAYRAADTSALAFNNALFDATQGGYRQMQADQTSAQDAIAGGYGDLAGMIGQRNRGLSGDYGATLGALQGGNQGIAGGYGQLQNQVLADIQGIGRTRAMDIEDAYARNFGAQQQRMISSGLGNSTVLNAIDRGLMTDRMRAQIANDESVSGLRARYRSDLGQAGLQFRERGLGAETDQRNRGLQFGERALGMEADQRNRGLQFDERGLQRGIDTQRAQLDWMNTIQAPYPDAGDGHRGRLRA